MQDIKICVDWKTLGIVLTIEDADVYSPDEFIPTCGYLELDVMEGHWTPALRMIQAQFDDTPDRYFDMILDDSKVADKVYEDGLQQYAEQMVGLAEAHAEQLAAEREDRADARRRGEW